MFKWPKTREAFWRTKIEGNRVRDAFVQAKLTELGWNVEVVWECELRTSADETLQALSALEDRIRLHRAPPSA